MSYHVELFLTKSEMESNSKLLYYEKLLWFLKIKVWLVQYLNHNQLHAWLKSAKQKS